MQLRKVRVDVSGDLDKLEGTWAVTSLVSDGKRMPAEMLSGARIVVKGDRFTSEGMGTEYAGRLETHQKKTPKAFDLIFTAGPEKGERHPGIYKLSGDRWTICLATRGSKRPKTFVSSPGSGIVLETLVRGESVQTKAKGAVKAKPAPAPTPQDLPVLPDMPSTGPATALDGEWEMVAAVLNGGTLGKSMMQWCKRITRGGVTAVIAGPRIMIKARFTLDYSIYPHGIEYEAFEGEYAGKKQSGIFELKGDALKICVAAPGKPRPDDFSSMSGDRRSYTAWRRTTK